jgi:hypothetical protein
LLRIGKRVEQFPRIKLRYGAEKYNKNKEYTEGGIKKKRAERKIKTLAKVTDFFHVKEN